MRVTIIAIGSRGDVQPRLALAAGLRRAGHDAVLATHPGFEALVRQHGVAFAPVAEGLISRGSETRAGRRWVQVGSRVLPAWVAMLRDAKSVARRRLADCLAACEGSDAIATSILGTALGWHVAEKLGIPLIRAYTEPPGSAPGGGRLMRTALWQLLRPAANTARRDVLGLPPLPRRDLAGVLDRQGVPLLYGYSPAVVPEPPRDDRARVTGWWFLHRPRAWEPPPALTEFLAAGPPPVFVGFGSTADRDPAATTALVVEALRLAGRRGVLVRGPFGLRGADLPPDVVAVDDVPYDWLFPRTAAVVHHGGGGTTAWGLLAGRPTVVVPGRFADQPFWGRRVHALGVGPAPIPRRRLTVDRLADAIRAAVADPAMRARAAALAQRARAEDGVGRAVEALERLVSPPAPVPASRPPADRTAAGS